MKFVNYLLAATTAITLTACQSTPTPQPRYIPDVALASSTILHVLPNRTSCHSSSPMQCLLVKKADDSDGEIFGIGYSDIIGFEPRVGVSYKIKVRQEIDQNTNQPTGYWHLEEILSQNLSR